MIQVINSTNIFTLRNKLYGYKRVLWYSHSLFKYWL
jgi:hypothetical protein